jgi:hypothetical protein
MENDLQMQEIQNPLDVQTAEGSEIQSGKDLPKI